MGKDKPITRGRFLFLVDQRPQQILERQVAAGQKAGWDSVRAGYIDEGWKDTLLIMPGERVKVLLKFEDYEGLFMYHCHNLEHEDMGMMRNYLIQA